MENQKSDGKSLWLLEAMHLPQDVIHEETLLTFVGKRTLKIENYRNILVYDDAEIRIQAKRYQLKISGKRLKIRYYDKEEMEIAGKIESVQFE